MNNDETKCASCGSRQLRRGKLGVWKHTFMPGERMMMLGYPVEGRVCLDCGFLGHYIRQSDLEKIRQRRA
jgi:ribosomal protein L37E